MDFDLTERQKMMKKEWSEWLNQEDRGRIPLGGKGLKLPGEAVRAFLESTEPLPFYLTLGIDPAGCKNSPYAEALTWVVLGEELAKISPSLFLGIEQSTRLFGWIIARYGSEEQIREFLAPIREGRAIGAVAMAESAGNFPEKEIRTHGQKEGDAYKLVGRKKQVINAPIADWLAVTAKVQDRWAIFLIQTGQPGLVMDESLKTTGYTDLAISGITLNQCLVPENRVIGPFSDPAPLDELETRANLMVAVSSMGVMTRVLEEAKKYTGESQNGSKPAQAYQEIRFKLAEMFTLWQTSHWLLCRAAWLLETGAREAETVNASAKVFVTEAAEVVAREAMQSMGWEGYSAGNQIEQCFRDARFGPVAGETSECLRMQIAEACLARYR